MRLRIWLVPLLIVQLVGCSAIRNYDKELTQVSQQVLENKVDHAISILDSNNKKEKDLLYFMEKGELLRIKGDLLGSQSAWVSANQKIQDWENAVKANPSKYIGGALSYVVNDKVRDYTGYDYEKVMLTTQMALNFIAQNDYNSARIAIRQTHEREAIITRLHEHLYLKQEEKAQEKGISTQFKDLNGYPVASLNTPAVVNLKNSYQSAFSHYLAGYIYESLGDRSMAAAGYRNAIELRPNIKVLESGLANLRSSTMRPVNHSDVLIILQSGLAPKRKTISITLPIPTKDGIIHVSVSLPVIQDMGLGSKNNNISINGRVYPSTEITSIDAMSRRALWDELPGIILRTSVRAAARAVTQQQLNKEVSPWAGLAVGIMGAILEQADVRVWRTLPESTQIIRVNLPKGENSFVLPSGEQLTVNIRNNYHVIQMIQIGNKVYLP